MSINIIVTDASSKHGLGIVRSLGKEGMKPYVLSYKRNSLSSFSKYSKGEIVISEDYHIDELLHKLVGLDVELIIAVGTYSFRKIIPWKSKLKANGVDVIAVDYDKLDFAFDKKRVYGYAEKIGVPIPKTIYPKKIEDIEAISNELNYPCVIKGLLEVGDNAVDYANTKFELVEKYQNLCKKYKYTEEDGLPMLQEYITGSGCAFFAVYNKGICGLTFQHKRIREYPVTGGASVCAESYKNILLESYGRALLDGLSWHGVAMVEFKLNSENIPVLMEINPKFWGSTDLALEAGVNFPKALVDIHFGKTVHYSNKYKYPFRYHWPFHGDLLHGFENPANLFSVIVDLFNPKVKSNFSIWDLAPSLIMIISFAKTVVKRLVQRRLNV